MSRKESRDWSDSAKRTAPTEKIEAKRSRDMERVARQYGISAADLASLHLAALDGGTQIHGQLAGANISVEEKKGEFRGVRDGQPLSSEAAALLYASLLGAAREKEGIDDRSVDATIHAIDAHDERVSKKIGARRK